VDLVERLLLEFNGETGKQGVIVAPFDVELFGHWWMEGLDWLRWALEGLSKSPHVEVVSASNYLEKHPPNEERSTCLRVHGVLEEPTISGTMI